jgi:hypothetical protein
MSEGIDVGRLGGLLARYLTSLGLALTLADETTGETRRMQADTAGAAGGALPIFLAAADAVCREALRLPIGIDLQPDADALLTVRVAGVVGAPFSVVMLCLMEAVERARGPDALVVNDLSRVASLARQHVLQAAS